MRIAKATREKKYSKVKSFILAQPSFLRLSESLRIKAVKRLE
nr:hypothetical protein [Vibrio cyclitrophicus]